MRKLLVVGWVIFATGAFASAAESQTALRDDNRSYSASISDRRYVAARCAGLYSEIAQSLASEQPSVSTAKAADARTFLERVQNPAEDVFLSWSSEYRKLLSTQSETATTLWHSDYEACSGILALIRQGDNLAKYSRDELRYLMGGPSKGPLK